MAAKGQPKSGGRQKGQPNRKTQELIDRAEEMGLDIFEEMLKSLQMEQDNKARFDMAKEIAQYLYPKRKALEVTGEAGEAISIVIKDFSRK